MRTIYLVRHGKVEFPRGVKRCIGRTDLPLDESGRQQARDLREYFNGHPVERVYCSQLSRSVETAEILAGRGMDSGGGIPIRVNEDLQEMYMGEWENAPMTDLHKTLEQEPASGEKRADALARMEQAVKELLKETEGDIAVVSHAGINCCFLAGIMGAPLDTSRALFQPYGGISKIAVSRKEDGDFHFQVLELGRMPKLFPEDEECREMQNHYRTPEQVSRHCRKVAEVAVKLGEIQIQQGISLNLGLIRSAALLHDIARHRDNHPLEGARILMREGYPVVADIIRQHHSLEQEAINEAAIVYLADKLIQGERTVTLEERFRDSEFKCRDSQGAMDAHEMYKEQAFRVYRMMY